MLKYRGNFLIEGEVSAAAADSSSSIEGLLAELEVFCEARGIDYARDSREHGQAGCRRRERFRLPS